MQHLILNLTFQIFIYHPIYLQQCCFSELLLYSDDTPEIVFDEEQPTLHSSH